MIVIGINLILLYLFIKIKAMVKLNVEIDQVMSKELLTLHPDHDLGDAADIFDRKHIHHIPVVDSGKLVGLISKSDFLFFRQRVNGREAEKKEWLRLKNQKVSGIMNTSLSTLTRLDNLSDAIDIFKANYYHAIPITEDGQLVGIVTPMDIMKFISEQ